MTPDAIARGTAERPSEDYWMVLAIIQPFRLDAVTLALEASPDFGGMTVSDCRGLSDTTALADPGRKDSDEQHERPFRRRHSDSDTLDFTSKVRIEVAVRGRAHAERIVETIARSAHTGNRGDGKVLAWPLARVVTVRSFSHEVLES